MLGKLKNRFIACFLILTVVFLLVGAQLSNLTMAQSGSLTVQSEDKKVRELTLTGSRGQILDITGIPLAYDQSSFDVEFTRDPSKSTPTDRAYYTDILIKTVDVIEKNGGSVINTFSIVRDDDGTFRFDFGITNPEDIAKRETNWRSNMFVSKTSAADVIYRDLRNRYRIPEEYTYEQARKLLSIWQESQLSSYRAYVPVKIATNIPMETVAIIESMSADLDGVSIAESSTRVYPKDDVAAHIIGYMGKMVDSATIEEMQAKGYSQDNTIGITGIESTMEAFLTGNSTERQGKREVEVNSSGKVITEISNTPATAGNNVMLTIDLQLQMALEAALEKNVNEVYEIQVEKYYEKQGTDEDYDKKASLQNRQGNNTLDKINLAKSGAAVVMDIHTGKVLAMASYPSYDLNLFAGGIPTDDYQALLDDKRAPLFNKAIASKGIPGSIFKMVTGTAGLMEGKITADTVINDEGPFDDYIKESYIVEGGRAPSCWVEPYFEEHQNDQTIVDALKVSCNYYFFRVADMLGVDSLVEWGDKFGLMTKTNIELTGEVVGQVGNQEVLYNAEKSIDDQKTSRPYLVRNQIMELLAGYGEQRGVAYDKDLLEETANELVALAALETTVGPEIRAILAEKLEIPETITKRNGWDNEINTELTQIQWNPTRTVLTGIGTDVTSVTPIAVARYVAALVNGGYVYDAQVVDSVIDANGNIVEAREPELWQYLDAPPEVLDLIKEGMREVTSAEDGGTAGQYFRDWKYEGQIGGKTGTGKVSDIDLENNAWFVAFTPYNDPEIAVVSYIPNGLGGTYAIPAARDIIEYYLDGEQERTETTIPSSNTLLVN
jgi:penicillin-binding protein 2